MWVKERTLGRGRDLKCLRLSLDVLENRTSQAWIPFKLRDCDCVTNCGETTSALRPWFPPISGDRGRSSEVLFEVSLV